MLRVASYTLHESSHRHFNFIVRSKHGFIWISCNYVGSGCEGIAYYNLIGSQLQLCTTFWLIAMWLFKAMLSMYGWIIYIAICSE